MAEPTTENLLTVTAYGATNRVQQIIDAMKLLEEMHGPRYMDRADIGRIDPRCKICRTARGKPCPWPCETYLRFAELFQIPVPESTVQMLHAIGKWRNGGRQPDWDKLGSLADAEMPAIGGAV